MRGEEGSAFFRIKFEKIFAFRYARILTAYQIGHADSTIRVVYINFAPLFMTVWPVIYKRG
jgi:hypothetical protein